MKRSNFDCSKCGLPEGFTIEFIPRTKDELIAHKLCFNCNFWRQYVGNPKSIVIDGEHFVDGGKTTLEPRGHGGRQFKIKMKDGTVIETNNLWYQGKIPPIYRKDIPDNAVFIPLLKELPDFKSED
jgi:hypothetical protein